MFSGWWGYISAPIIILEPAPENCPECHGEGAVATTVITETGEILYIGIGQLVDHADTQIRIWSAHHKPLPDAATHYEMRNILANWLISLGFKQEALSRIEYDAATDVEARRAGPRQEHTYPTIVRLPLPRWHQTIFSNVHLLSTHTEWPTAVSNAMKHEAQYMAGYFFGHPVTARQMGNLEVQGERVRDTSVQMKEEAWVEPFVLADNCIFCTQMTDETVIARVDAFQWAIDKEVFNGNVLNSNGPATYSHNFYTYETVEQRREYHRLVKLGECDNVHGLRLLDLTALPHHLQRVLCIKWNHIVRDWLATDLRYLYRDGNYYVIDTIPITPTVFTDFAGAPPLAATDLEYLEALGTAIYLSAALPIEIRGAPNA